MGNVDYKSLVTDAAHAAYCLSELSEALELTGDGEQLLASARKYCKDEIEVPDRKAFLDAVTKTVTKGIIKSYYEPDLWEKSAERERMEKFAVIDTETNWNDEVMSIGIVIADVETKEKISSEYYIIDPEYRVGGMFSSELRTTKKEARITDRKQALGEIQQWMDSYQVKKLFAYNASFDKKHLPEYSGYQWYDIMRLAAYRQYNNAIPASAECCKTGRLKRGYGVEEILQMLSRNNRYHEKHNAVSDAEDELEIMRLLGHDISVYDIALLSTAENPVKGQQKEM